MSKAREVACANAPEEVEHLCMLGAANNLVYCSKEFQIRKRTYYLRGSSRQNPKG